MARVESGHAPTVVRPDIDGLRRRTAEVMAQGVLLQQQLSRLDLWSSARATRAVSDRLRAEAVAIRAERKRYANTVLELRELVAQLQDALANRAVIEQAKGMIMAQSRCTSDQAFDVLRRASQRTNRKVRDIATELVSRSQEVTSKAP
jgi:hypothetical protein